MKGRPFSAAPRCPGSGAIALAGAFDRPTGRPLAECPTCGRVVTIGRVERRIEDGAVEHYGRIHLHTARKAVS